MNRFDVVATHNHRILVFLVVLSLGLVGMNHTMLGAALPAMRDTFGISIAKSGIIGSFSWLGFTIAILCSGVLSDLFSSRQVLGISCALTGACSILIGISTNFILHCVLIVLIGAGGGAIVVCSSAAIVELFSRKKSALLNIQHFFYTIGAVLGPICIGFALSHNLAWQIVYRVVGVVYLGVSVSILSPKFTRNQYGSSKHRISYKQLFKMKTLYILFFVGFLAIGAQNGFYFWIISYLKEVHALPILWSSLSLALFSAGMGIGRLISAWLSMRLHPTKLLLMLLIFVTAALVSFNLITTSSLLSLMCFFIGLGCSGIFPLILALASSTTPDSSGSAMGIVGTSVGLGSIVMPLWMSLLTDRVSMRASMILVPLTAFMALVVFALGLSGFTKSSTPESDGLL